MRERWFPIGPRKESSVVADLKISFDSETPIYAETIQEMFLGKKKETVGVVLATSTTSKWVFRQLFSACAVCTRQWLKRKLGFKSVSHSIAFAETCECKEMGEKRSPLLKMAATVNYRILKTKIVGTNSVCGRHLIRIKISDRWPVFSQLDPSISSGYKGQWKHSNVTTTSKTTAYSETLNIFARLGEK